MCNCMMNDNFEVIEQTVTNENSIDKTDYLYITKKKCLDCGQGVSVIEGKVSNDISEVLNDMQNDEIESSNNKFKVGDIIKRVNQNQYSHASIYSSSFVVAEIKENEYVLQKPNFMGNMSIDCVDSIFEIDDNAKGFILNIQEHVLNNKLKNQ